MALVAVRSVNWLSRVSGRGSGTVVGGRVGLALCPQLLGELARGRMVILVSGTNGKTTTTAMIAAGWGGEVTTNGTGANMPAGHVAALAKSSASHVVLEVDEAWLPEVIARTAPRVVVLLNLSRDQLDRANEVRQMAERWRHSLAENPNEQLVVVANANDPLVVYAARESQRIRWCSVPTPWLEDARSCPRCTMALEHVGASWHCACGFAQPSDIVATLDETLVIGSTRLTLDLSIPGAFNESNATMALTALREVGVAITESVTRINALRTVAGRFALRRWGPHTLRLLLAKNPAGFAAILSTITPESRDVWIAINARVADGRDPSWLYDVPFEQLHGHRVWCLGERRLDLATRLDYAGVESYVVDDESTLEYADLTIPLVANYTAFSQWLAKSSPC